MKDREEDEDQQKENRIGSRSMDTGTGMETQISILRERIWKDERHWQRMEN